MQTSTSQIYSGGQSTNSQVTPSQDVKEITTGYRTAISSGKKLPDNPGGGDSWDGNEQDK